LTPECAGLVKSKELGLGLPKAIGLHLPLKISYAGCFSPSPTISAQFTVEVCFSPKSPKNSLKPPYYRGSRSFKGH